MKKVFAILALLIVVSKVNAVSLSDSLRISILTVSPGDELYSTFGHTAIRITDLKQGYDIVFNYGTFDFQTPNFYLKFALGRLDYKLSVESFQGFYESASAENRSIIEQLLDLTKAEKLQLANLLIINYLPENRDYRYKFFTDNCATRVRDILVTAVGDSDILKEPAIKADETYRRLFTSYLGNMEWSRFGIELVLGKMTDDISGYNSLFLPDNLMISIDDAKKGTIPLVKSKTEIYKALPLGETSIFLSPLFICLVLVIIGFLVQLMKRVIHIFDTVVFLTLGFLGLFIFTMSLASEHAEVQHNFVTLFFIPTVILIPFCKNKMKERVIAVSYVISILSFIAIPFIPQTFNHAVLLLSLFLNIRLFFNLHLRNLKN